MRQVKMVAKEIGWFKPGTEVWDYDTNCRFTEEEYKTWTKGTSIPVAGIRVSESDGTEYKDREICEFDEFDITIMEALKPCPFCGCQELEMFMCEVECCGGQPRSVECPCGATLSGNWKTEEIAIAEWNKRHV